MNGGILNEMDGGSPKFTFIQGKEGFFFDDRARALMSNPTDAHIWPIISCTPRFFVINKNKPPMAKISTFVS